MKNGQRTYFWSKVVGVAGLIYSTLGLYLVPNVGFITALFLITHGISLVIFGFILYYHRKSNEKNEAKLDQIIKLLKKK